MPQPTRIPRATAADVDAFVRYVCSIRIDGDDELDGVIIEYPGSMVRVHVEVRFVAEAELDKCRAVLRYQASGSGSPETHAFAMRTLLSGTVKPDVVHRQTFALYLPESVPLTYEGVYVKVAWSVAVEFIAPDGRLLVEEVPLIVRPRPVDWRPGDSAASIASIATTAIDTADVDTADQSSADDADPLDDAAATDGGFAVIADPPSDEIPLADDAPAPTSRPSPKKAPISAPHAPSSADGDDEVAEGGTFATLERPQDDSSGGETAAETAAPPAPLSDPRPSGAVSHSATPPSGPAADRPPAPTSDSGREEGADAAEEADSEGICSFYASGEVRKVTFVAPDRPDSPVEAPSEDEDEDA